MSSAISIGQSTACGTESTSPRRIRLCVHLSANAPSRLRTRTLCTAMISSNFSSTRSKFNGRSSAPRARVARRDETRQDDACRRARRSVARRWHTSVDLRRRLAPAPRSSLRPASKNDVGMVAWLLTAAHARGTGRPPAGSYRKRHHRDVGLRSGLERMSCLTLASKYARAGGRPRLYLAANSGARIGPRRLFASGIASRG